MPIDIDEEKVRRNEFALWLAWTVATTLGMLAGYLPMALLVGSLDLGIARVLVPIVSGVLIGLAQWLVLRGYIIGSHDWVLNHAGGWVIGYTLGLFVVQWLSRTALGELVGFIVFGIIVAVFQWPVLRREIPHLAPWILANVVGWAGGAYLSQFISGIVFQKTLPNTVSSVLVIIGVTGIVAGAFIGIALIWIVRQPDQLTPKSR